MPDISKLIIEVDSRGVVNAEGNMAAFEAMAKKVGKTTDDTAKKMGALQLVINKLPGPLKSVAAGLMGLVDPATAVVGVFLEIGEAAAKYVKESIQAYQEQEVQLVRLEAVLKATGAAAWTTSSDLSKYANSLQSTTGRSSNEIMQMQSVLLGFTNITGENFTRLTSNMLDMADVMGGSLTAAANTFGKALDTPSESISALSRYGFKFTEEEKRMIKAMEEANDVAGAQVVILKSMERAFGGAAAATGKTIDGLKRISETLKEQLKALEAEEKGWSDWARAREQGKVADYQRQIDQILRKKELLEAVKNLEGDSASEIIKAAEILKGVESDEDYGNLRSLINKLDSFGLSNYTLGIVADKEELQKLIDLMKPFADLEKAHTAELEKKSKLINAVKNSYKDMMDIVNETYDQSTQKKIKDAQEMIDKLIKFRDSGTKTEMRREFDPGTKTWKEEDVITGLSKEDIDKANVSIDNWLEKLNKLKNPIADWVKVLARATEFTEDNVRAWGGLQTVIKYASDGIDKVRERYEQLYNEKPIYELLGMDKTEIYDAAYEKAKAFVQMMTDARLKDTKPWSVEEDASYNEALRKLGEEREKRDTEYFYSFIKELEKERQLLESSPALQVYDKIEKQLKDGGMIDPAMEQVFKYIEETGTNYLAGLAVQLKDAGKSTYDLAVKRLVIEQGISEETAKQAIDAQKKIDYIANGRNYMGEIMTSIDDALRSIRAGNGGYGQYAEGRFAQAGMNLIQGSDAGNFVQGMEMGGPLVGLLNMLAGALERVLGGMEGVDMILSPVTGLFEELSDVIKAFLLPLLIVSKGISAIGAGLNWALNLMTGGLFKEMGDTYDLLVSTNDERKNEEERIRALNEQYAKLYGALKEQEEYYLQQRRHLNSEWAVEQYQTTRVNDMILSPHGAFSTDPKDYIIATKHPESLMEGGAAVVNISIINNSDANISKQESVGADGAREIQIYVDGLVQQGMANGRYDGAFDAMSSRRNGKRVHA